MIDGMDLILIDDEWEETKQEALRLIHRSPELNCTYQKLEALREQTLGSLGVC